MDPIGPVPGKREVFEALLAEGWTFLHLDGRQGDVVLPEAFRNNPHVVLQYGLDLPVPIPDLTVDERGVHATLSFSRKEQLTFVPWSAVYAMSLDDGRGMLFAEDVPAEVAPHITTEPLPDGATLPGAVRPLGGAQVGTAAAPSTSARPATAARPAKPEASHLRAVGDLEPPSTSGKTPPPQPLGSRPALRLVK